MLNCKLKVMKLLVTLVLILVTAHFSQAQNVGIGTNTPHASAALEITSTTRGMLVPRMFTTQRLGIASPAKGLLVFDNNTNSFWYHNGTAWTELNQGGATGNWDVNSTHIFNSNAGNVGIGNNEPLNKLQVSGNFLVSAPATATSTAPTAAQEKTILNNSTLIFLSTDSTGRIYDPGGPLGNYLPNLLGYANINPATQSTGIELIAESLQLGTGDSLIIREFAASPVVLLAFGSGNTTLGRWVFNTTRLHCTFKSNADANTGSGFSLLFKRLYDNTAAMQNANGYAGNSLFFDTKNGAVRAGKTSTAAIGPYSSAMGSNNTATGNNSVAFGVDNEATGSSSIALGGFNEATGDFSAALGTNTQAVGYAATALGRFTNATGDFSMAAGSVSTASATGSTALGGNTVASADYSTATGRYTDAIGYAATAIGDSSLASGPLSFAAGFRTVASGNTSTAMGRYTDAIGYAATAMGDSTLASGLMSFATGFRTTASGNYAAAMGSGTMASGNYAAAMGYNTTAGGNYATAMGFITTASGTASTAMGDNTIASGRNSTAMGESTTASGNESTAMGYFTTASGDRSTAIGSYVSANGQVGSLVIGDYSTSTIMNSAGFNSFRARFEGGYRFYTSSDLTTSCALSAGSNAWSTTSDSRLKENFEPVNGEDFLNKISLLSLTSWNYKKQNPQTFRHYGPMAQDFFAAFGKDKYGTIGNDTTINSADFDGVNLIAIQALEKRTQKIQQLETDNAKLQKELNDLKVRLQKIEAVLQKSEL
jgi:hypothetical protein